MIQSRRVIFAKPILEPYEIVETKMLIEDIEGNIIVLALYNYVHFGEDPKSVFPVGTYLVF